MSHFSHLYFVSAYGFLSSAVVPKPNSTYVSVVFDVEDYISPVSDRWMKFLCGWQKP